MNLLQAILMGVVQGLSEFLPISSSAHIVFTSSLFKYFTGAEIAIHSSEEVFFDIMLHLGTLVAVLIFFRKEIWDIIKALYVAIKTQDFTSRDSKLGVFIILGTFMTCLVAYPLKEISEKLVHSPSIVGILLIFTGVFLIISEWYSRVKAAKTDSVTLKSAIFIGIAQGLAAFPGLSRSGLTMATGLFNGLDRLTAARYSFLLSIPIILATSMLYPFLEVEPHEFATFHWRAIVIGSIVSGFVGYICIKYFLKFIAKYSLAVFAYYCIGVGAVMAVFFRFFA